MWRRITNPAKELIVNCKIKQSSEGIEKVYNINMIEHDQFHIQLILKNDVPVKEVLRITLTAKQVLDYKFEMAAK
jgi:hypothetical protein